MKETAMEKQATIYKNEGISNANYSKYIADIKGKLTEFAEQDPILVNKIVDSVYDQLVYEENEPLVEFNGNVIESISFQSRKEMRDEYVESLKERMNELEILEKDNTKPKSYRKQMAIQIVKMTTMYEALNESNIDKLKDCFSKSNGDINVFTATHSIIQFNGTRHGLKDDMLISAVFYDGISGNPELLLKLNTAETEEEQKEIIKNNIEIIGITYWGNQQEPKWAIITDESPYMYLMLFRPKQ